MAECGITICITLDGEHLINECFTATSSDADDALAHAIEALQGAERVCDERCDAEWELMMAKRQVPPAAKVSS